MMSFERSRSPNGVVFYIFDHVVKFESERRNCKVCGERLEAGQRGLGVLLNCEQEVVFENPGNFFVHGKCVKKGLGQTVDEVLAEYGFVRKFMGFYGKKWREELLLKEL